MSAKELLTTLEQKVHPTRAALVLVDVQNDFVHEEGYLGKLGAPLDSVRAIVPKLNELMNSAREARVPIVHVISYHDEQYASVVVTEQKLRNGHDLVENGRQRRDAPYCVRGTFGSELYGVKALPGEEIVTKLRYSGFQGTNLDLLLRSWGIQTVILAGTATNVCVESTARDVYSHDYYLVFISDCTASTSQEAHSVTLGTVETYFGQVACANDIMASWSSGKGDEPGTVPGYFDGA